MFKHVLLALLALMMVAPMAHATTGFNVDAPGAKDPAFLSRYPGSVLGFVMTRGRVRWSANCLHGATRPWSWMLAHSRHSGRS